MREERRGTTGFRERRGKELVAVGEAKRVAEEERRSSDAEVDGRGGRAGLECSSSPSLGEGSVGELDLCDSDIVVVYFLDI